MMAVEFLNLAEIRLKTLNESLNNKFLEILMHGTFEDLVNFTETNKDTGVINENKTQVSHSELSLRPIVYSKLKYWMNKTASTSNNLSKFQSREMKNDKLNFKLNLLWKYDTLKCIDATALYIETIDDEALVFIGSHSSIFACIDAKTGLERWKFNAEDRIESTACVSKCGDFVIFGNIKKNITKKNFI